MKMIGVAMALAFAGPGVVHAQTLPRFAVEQWCNQVAKAAGARSEMIYGGCITQEQTAYDTIKKSWYNLPSQTRTWCESVAKAAGPGSYMLLNGCVDQETAAAKANSSTQFRR